MALLAGMAILPAAARADVDAPLLNAYAKARLADSDGALGIAVTNYRQALAADPQNPLVAIRSYRQALESGDMTLALRAAHVLDDAGVLPHDGTVLLVIDALGHKNWADARRLAGRLEAEENFAFLAPILISWVSLGEGRYAPPVVDASSRYGSLARRYVDEHIALQLLSQGQGQGEAALIAARQALAIGTKPQNGLRLLLAGRLAAFGRKDAALAMLPVDVPAFARARAEIAEGRRSARAPALTPQQGFARLLARLSEDISADGTRAVSLALARLATFGDPTSAEFRLLVATRLLAAEQPDAALIAVGTIPPTSWYALPADDLRVDALVAQGRRDEALTLARNLTQRPDAGAGQQVQLASILLDDKAFPEAAAAYHAAQAYYPEGRAPWSLYLLEGSALDRSGRWDEARVVLTHAAALAPDEPVILNYLGYAQVERGQNVAEALALLRRASALKPRDPSITDSLGWAHYVAGDASSAVPVLERAAAAAPTDVTINEHLGDAYWAVGRRYEARYAWSAARTVAEGDDIARLAAKLRDGPQAIAKR